MKPKTSSTSTTPLHCQYRTASGRFCRLPVTDTVSALCFSHAVRQQKDRDLAELASALTGEAEDFQTAAGINHSLGELYKQLADNKIAPRRAAVLAYISNLLLRTLPAMDRESGEEDFPQVILDLPRPIRDEHPTRHACPPWRASPACPGPLGESHRDDPAKPS